MKSKPVSVTVAVAVLVDDDPTQRTMLTGLLNKAGLSTRAFIGADLYMPGIDGWRFCRLLRSPEYASLNDVPILVVSATFVGAGWK